MNESYFGDRQQTQEWRIAQTNMRNLKKMGEAESPSFALAAGAAATIENAMQELTALPAHESSQLFRHVP